MNSGEQNIAVPLSSDGDTTVMRTARIRHLNDRLRMSAIGGRMMITNGVSSLPPQQLAIVLRALREFDAFTEDNDPYDEHDFGAIDVISVRAFWKIDYYDASLEFGSPDPANPAVTTRVLTLMLASEY